MIEFGRAPNSDSKKPAPVLISAVLFTLLVPAIGYRAFGVWPALLFFIGYLSGLIGWILFPSRATYDSIKIPYLVTFLLFVAHRVEEKVSGFFMTLAQLTGVPTPDVASPAIIVLLLVSVAAWILGPFLLRRGLEFGHYLVWTFFASMGITELAHFVFPLFRDEPDGYFPGMMTVFVLAPAAWYGIHILVRTRSIPVSS